MRTHAIPMPLMGRLLPCLARAGLALVWATLVGSTVTYAQTFNSGSTGADGALNLTTPGTIIFNPRAFTPPLDPEGDNVYHFTTITIAAGVTVRLVATHVPGPVFWLASGAVQIAGTIDLNGEAGHNPPATPAERRPSLPGAGGYPGGIGVSPNGPAQPGSGPLGGVSGRGGGNPSNSFLVPLLGGSGGGGGTPVSIGGGAGGGALLIASSQSIAITGTIQATGGNSAVICGGGAAGSCRSGGGGGGGSLRFVSPLISGTGTLRVTGGDGVSGVQGGAGIIRLEAFQHTFTGTTQPGRILASPFALFLPSAPPSTLRVLSVAGVSVASDPTGSFTTPDVTFNAATAVPVVIEAHNIPPDTVVRLHLFSENGADQIVIAPPLVGTLAVSTTTASAVFPVGFSRGFVRATW